MTTCSIKEPVHNICLWDFYRTIPIIVFNCYSGGGTTIGWIYLLFLTWRKSIANRARGIETHAVYIIMEINIKGKKIIGVLYLKSIIGCILVL